VRVLASQRDVFMQQSEKNSTIGFKNIFHMGVFGYAITSLVMSHPKEVSRSGAGGTQHIP